MVKSIHIAVIIFLVFLAGLFFAQKQNKVTTNEEKKEVHANLVLTYDGKEKALNVEVARTDSEREKGLMFRNSLGADEGMLFVFPESSIKQFWMKNTYIPLDIYFFDENGAFVDAILKAEPCVVDTQCTVYSSKKSARYGLELLAGALPAIENLQSVSIQNMKNFE